MMLQKKNRGLAARGTQFIATVALAPFVLLACPSPFVEIPQGSVADEDYRRCKDQQQVGDARGCWKVFLRKHGTSASEAQLDYAKRQSETPAVATYTAPTYTAPRPTYTAPVPTYTAPPQHTTTAPEPTGEKSRVLVYHEWMFFLEGTESPDFVIVNRKALKSGVHIKLAANSNGYFNFVNSTGRYACYSGTFFMKHTFSIKVPDNLDFKPVSFEQSMAFGNWTITKENEYLKIAHLATGTSIMLWQNSNGWVEIVNKYGKKTTVYSGMNPPGIPTATTSKI